MEKKKCFNGDQTSEEMSESASFTNDTEDFNISLKGVGHANSDHVGCILGS